MSVPLSFMRRALSLLIVCAFATTAVACASMSEGGASGKRESLYPRRPTSGGPPLADPPLQRPTIHFTLRAEGLTALLDALVPKVDTGTYALLGERAFTWARGPFTLAFDDARRAMTAKTEVRASVDVPGTQLEDLLLKVTADVQPVLTSSYQLALQAVTVHVTSDNRRVRVAQWGGGLMARIEAMLQEKLAGLKVDLSPVFAGLDAKLAAPFRFKVGEASACFALDVRSLEAGPAVLADGLEKELALTVAPSVTMPCTAPSSSPPGAAATGSGSAAVPAVQPVRVLPPLRNAGSLEGGPFALTVPIAASYDELQRAMLAAFTDGKLFFSTDQPGLYLSDPEVFASDGQVIVRLRLGGFAEKGVRLDLDGDLYLAGRPTVRDNFLELPDLRPTIETSQALVNLAVAFRETELTDAARRALRLDLSARLAGLRDKLTDALTVKIDVVDGVPPLCTKVDVGRVEVSDLFAHDAYLRIYVKTTALASASLPCAP